MSCSFGIDSITDEVVSLILFIDVTLPLKRPHTEVAYALIVVCVRPNYLILRVCKTFIHRFDSYARFIGSIPVLDSSDRFPCSIPPLDSRARFIPSIPSLDSLARFRCSIHQLDSLARSIGSFPCPIRPLGSKTDISNG